MLIPFGILSAAGAGGAVAGGDYELIETTILGSDTSSVTFSSLATYASTYKHLQIRYASRSARTDNANDSLAVRLNADTGTNYARHGLLGYLGAVLSSASTSASRMDMGWQTTNSQSANIFGSGVIDLLDTYSTSKNTTLRGLSGTSGTEPIIILNSGVWLNTASLTSITLFAGFSGLNLVAGSRFSLYGIRG